MNRMLGLSAIAILAGCTSTSPRPAHESDAHCIHRLYDYPDRSMPFPTAAATCRGNRPVDLTGDHYFQVLASSLNVPYVTHDPKGDDKIVLTGSRLAQPTSETPPPQLLLR